MCVTREYFPFYFVEYVQRSFLVAARLGYDLFVDLEVHLLESEFDMPTYHRFHLVYIDTGKLFLVNIEVHIEMTGLVFLDNLEEVPAFRGCRVEDLSKNVS